MGVKLSGYAISFAVNINTKPGMVILNTIARRVKRIITPPIILVEEEDGANSGIMT